MTFTPGKHTSSAMVGACRGMCFSIISRSSTDADFPWLFETIIVLWCLILGCSYSSGKRASLGVERYFPASSFPIAKTPFLTALITLDIIICRTERNWLEKKKKREKARDGSKTNLSEEKKLFSVKKEWVHVFILATQVLKRTIISFRRL